MGADAATGANDRSFYNGGRVNPGGGIDLVPVERNTLPP